MPVQLPLEPSVPNYRVGCAIGGRQFIFDVRWNTRSEAWYVDILLEDETPLAHGLKIVLGANLGRRIVDTSRFLGMLSVVDTSGEGRDAGLDDLGTRVQVWFFGLEELQEEA